MKAFRPALLLSSFILLAAGEPMTVEVRTGGDDGLTQRLADAVRDAFAVPARYAGPSRKDLVVTIPTHVAWKNVGSRTKITYKVEFAIGSTIIRRTGSCWENNMTVCARKIVKAAASIKPL